MATPAPAAATSPTPDEAITSLGAETRVPPRAYLAVDRILDAGPHAQTRSAGRAFRATAFLTDENAAFARRWRRPGSSRSVPPRLRSRLKWGTRRPSQHAFRKAGRPRKSSPGPTDPVRISVPTSCCARRGDRLNPLTDQGGRPAGRRKGMESCPSEDSLWNARQGPFLSGAQRPRPVVIRGIRNVYVRESFDRGDPRPRRGSGARRTRHGQRSPSHPRRSATARSSARHQKLVPRRRPARRRVDEELRTNRSDRRPEAARRPCGLPWVRPGTVEGGLPSQPTTADYFLFMGE